MKNVVKKFENLMKDEKGGPGLEETVLLVFIGLVVANAADTLGKTINSAFSSAVTKLKTALGVA